jgi:hypothetical protein
MILVGIKESSRVARRPAVWCGPYRGGRLLPGAPVRNTQSTPSSIVHRFTSRSLRQDCRSPKRLFHRVILFAPEFRLDVCDR